MLGKEATEARDSIHPSRGPGDDTLLNSSGLKPEDGSKPDDALNTTQDIIYSGA
jgi:hypothetical protein